MNLSRLVYESEAWLTNLHQLEDYVAGAERREKLGQPLTANERLLLETARMVLAEADDYWPPERYQ